MCNVSLSKIQDVDLAGTNADEKKAAAKASIADYPPNSKEKNE